MKPRAPKKRRGWNSSLPAPSKPLRATGRLPRKTRITAKNAKRKGHRFPKGVDEAYREWVRGQWCVVGVLCLGETQAHHVRTRGAGGADRNNLLPLCERHHAQWHTMGRRSWQAFWGIDAVKEAAELGQRYAAASRAAEPREDRQCG